MTPHHLTTEDCPIGAVLFQTENYVVTKEYALLSNFSYLKEMPVIYAVTNIESDVREGEWLVLPVAIQKAIAFNALLIAIDEAQDLGDDFDFGLLDDTKTH